MDSWESVRFAELVHSPMELTDDEKLELIRLVKAKQDAEEALKVAAAE